MSAPLFLIVLQSVYCSEVIWKDNKPTELLVEIFNITELKDVHNLGEAAPQANSKWVRPKFMESWHAFSLLDRKKRAALEKIIKKSALIKEKPPKKQYYDMVIVLGCFPDRLTRRFDYLTKLHNRGVKFGKISLLGMNPYIKSGSGFDKEIGIPNSKKELSSIEVIWDQLEKSEELKKVPVEILNTQKVVEGYGAASDKILKHIAKTQDLNNKSILIVSDGCYGCNQGALAEKALKKYGAKVDVETVWDAAQVKYPVEVVLDFVAKCLYYLHKWVKKNDRPLTD